MLLHRPSLQRGYFDHGWLKTFHTFSFADYMDKRYMGFHSLRVINEDQIDKGAGFPIHSHRDMEIVTYVISGALEHKDTLGNTTVIRPGEIQRMSAGSGIEHSEFNHSKSDSTHLLQIWILPEKKGLQPSYDQRSFEKELDSGKRVLLASNDGREDSVVLHRDVSIFGGRFSGGTKEIFNLQKGRALWLQVVKGGLQANTTVLAPGDGLGITDEAEVLLDFKNYSEILAFDMFIDR